MRSPASGNFQFKTTAVFAGRIESLLKPTQIRCLAGGPTFFRGLCELISRSDVASVPIKLLKHGHGGSHVSSKLELMDTFVKTERGVGVPEGIDCPFLPLAVLLNASGFDQRLKRLLKTADGRSVSVTENKAIDRQLRLGQAV